MQIVINNIKMPVNHKIEDVLLAAQEFVRQQCIYADNFYIYRQSIDARHKKSIKYIYSVAAEVNNGAKILPNSNLQIISQNDEIKVESKKVFKKRPVVVGMGPCGLFTAYILTLSGNPPLIIERGGMVEERVKSVEEFWNSGKLNTESNVQFGEGGAGTFSDGKLNTGIKDKRQRFILKTFVRFGAPNDILYKSKPHIGTDKLRNVLINMRKYLLDNGCEVQFNTTLTSLKMRNGNLSEIELNNDKVIECDKLFLSIGHSSRDTYEMLYKAGVKIEAKPFAAGVRIEHKQEFISRSQYGVEWKSLPPADYKLVYNGKDRSCYSFCMCPGGYVVNASSEDERLVVNGMSDYKRDAENANSALVVSVRPEDFETNSPLAGIEFQRKYESMAFKLGGSDFSAPVQLAKDFLAGKKSSQLESVNPSFTGKTVLSDLRSCLPEFISDTLSEGLRYFDNKIKGFASGGAIMTGVEMRTSAPVRIARDNNFESVGIQGLYPAGEGAGYAGGIISAALDGIRVALAAIESCNTGH